MNITYRKATLADIDTLIKLRFEYLIEILGALYGIENESCASTAFKRG